MKISKAGPLIAAASLAAAVSLVGCTQPQILGIQNVSTGEQSDIEWLAYRVRADFDTPLNADSGWAAPENTGAQIFYDQPFRLRIQVQADSSPAEGHLLSLQYRQADLPWQTLGFAEFPYPSFATPAVSVISAQAYANGDETEKLLGPATIAWDEGAGLSAVSTTPVWRLSGEAVEWEWPLVIRRFSDGPTFVEDNTRFEFRVVDRNGVPLVGHESVQLDLTAEPQHLGGTFIETPSRIGPYQSELGHLYFFMEPSETDNRFMAVMSEDFGRSWREVDGANRPGIGDLEGVATVRAGSTIHIIHQISEEVLYHQFEMGDGLTTKDTWRVDSESIAVLDEPPTQFADVVARQDGSLVALYAGAHKLFLQERSAAGVWGEAVEIDSHLAPDLSGPALAIGPGDQITLAYSGLNGQGFIRHLRADRQLSQRLTFSEDTGTTDPENGPIVPMVVLPESGTTVLVYRERSGLLFERRFSADGQLSPPVQISSIPVVTNAVDAEQVAADLVLHNNTLHLLFIDDQSRSIYYSRSTAPGAWSEPEAVITNVDAAWVRGSVHRDASGNPVYGFVFDAGSTGGSGFNRYFSLPL